MTFEEYKVAQKRLYRESDAVLMPLDAQIAQLTKKRQQLAAFWEKQLQELHQQYIAAAPYKVDDIVQAKSMTGLTEVYKITRVTAQINPWKDGSFVYWGVPELTSNKWAKREQILGDIKAVESTEGK